MDLLESSTHSFIIKIWLDERATEERGRDWHGQITHVPSGKRRYLKDLDEIAAFIRPVLRETGVKLNRRGRLRRWLNKQKQ